jgi:hypothetical protein
MPDVAQLPEHALRLVPAPSPYDAAADRIAARLARRAPLAVTA